VKHERTPFNPFFNLRPFPLPFPFPLLALSFLLVGLAALLPRVLDLGLFVTHDEAEFWIDRSETFLLALQSGDEAATAISTHPGVTTMWLGAVGVVLRRVLRAWGLLHETPFPTMLALMQLPVALTHTAGVILGYGLLRRLFPALVALLAALLWATDPFLIGYSRLLHVDMLAGTFGTLSLLAACVFWNHPRSPSHPSPSPSPRGLRWLVLSGSCAGLAILSKSPALALLPVVVVLAFVSGMDDMMEQHPEEEPESQTPRSWWPRTWVVRVLLPLLPLAVWGGACAVTVALVWPAIRADPVQVYHLLRTGVEAEGANPHMTGNFFLGQEDPAPGPRYYPVALALRTTPWSLAGLLLLPLVFRGWGNKVRGRSVGTLAGFVILFVLAMSLFPKKFDRYLLPVFPAVDILAAVGLMGFWWTGGGAAHDRSGAPGRTFLAKVRGYLSRLRVPIAVVIVLVALLNAAWYHPYSIIAFNQVFGGTPTGARTFSMGWGEGFDQVASWLNDQTDITGVVTAAIMIPTLNPYLRHGAQATTPRTARLPDQTGYVVVYLYQAQGTVFPPFDRFYPRATPVHTVTIHNVDYAWVYQVPPPVEYPREARFGATIHLRGYTVAKADEPGNEQEKEPGNEHTVHIQRGRPLVFKLFWETRAAPPRDFWLFAHLVGPDGHPYLSLDIPYDTSTWRANRFRTTELPIPIPADLPDGTSSLVIGLYDPSDGQRLPLTTTPPPDPTLDGPNALLLTRVVVE
jgi:hypothetical protein